MICLVTWERKLHVGACRGHQEGARGPPRGQTRGHQEGGGGFQGPPRAARVHLYHMSSECFPFSKNSGLKFWKFHLPNGIVQSAELISPKPLHGWHRMWKGSTGDNNFVKWKRAMKWPDWSKWTTFRGGRKINILVRPNPNSLFHLISYLKIP